MNVTVTLRPGATSTTGGRKERCCRRDWTTPFVGGGGEPISNWKHSVMKLYIKIEDLHDRIEWRVELRERMVGAMWQGSVVPFWSQLSKKNKI